jgi:hypothetical protein
MDTVFMNGATVSGSSGSRNVVKAKLPVTGFTRDIYVRNERYSISYHFSLKILIRVRLWHSSLGVGCKLLEKNFKLKSIVTLIKGATFGFKIEALAMTLKRHINKIDLIFNSAQKKDLMPLHYSALLRKKCGFSTWLNDMKSINFLAWKHLFLI